MMDAASARATGSVPGIPRDVDGPVFREPWEAQAFAMALALHKRGLFTWPEWAAALAAEIKLDDSTRDLDELLASLGISATYLGVGVDRID